MSPSVVILAGGRSTRLGTEKAFARVGDRTVFERQLEAARDATDIVLSVRTPGRFAEALQRAGWAAGERFTQGVRSIRIVSDPEPDLGPVAGLAAALAVVDEPTAVVLAGDMPFVKRELVTYLGDSLEARAGLDAAVPVVRGRMQGLCAAYRRSVADRAAALVARTATRGPSVRDLLAELDLFEVGEEDLGAVGDPTVLTLGIDTPEELERARRLAAREG